MKYTYWTFFVSEIKLFKISVGLNFKKNIIIISENKNSFKPRKKTQQKIINDKMKSFCASTINQMENYLSLLIKYLLKNKNLWNNCPVFKCKMNEGKK